MDGESFGGGRQKNVLGGVLIPCSVAPMTGFFRDGCCNTGPEDIGSHTVCAVMTDDFLHFSKAAGNDLMTPREEYGFPGLRAGDSWCLCASKVGTSSPGWGSAICHSCSHKRDLSVCRVFRRS